MVLVLLPGYLRGEFHPRGANRLGKLTTISLCLCLVPTILGWREVALPFTLLTGALGLSASLNYLRQVLEDRRLHY